MTQLYMCTHIYSFSYSFPLWFITGYWTSFPVFYSRTLLFIHPVYDSLHLLTDRITFKLYIHTIHVHGSIYAKCAVLTAGGPRPAPPSSPAKRTEAPLLRLGLKGWEISIEKKREGGEKESISRTKNYFCEGKDEGSTQESDAPGRCGV